MPYTPEEFLQIACEAMAKVSSPAVFLGDVKTLNSEPRFVPHTQVTDDILMAQIKVREDLYKQMVGQAYTMMLKEQIADLKVRVQYLKRGGDVLDMAELQSASLEVVEEQIDLRIITSQSNFLSDELRKTLMQEAGALLDRLYAPEHVAMLWEVMEGKLKEAMAFIPQVQESTNAADV